MEDVGSMGSRDRDYVSMTHDGRLTSDETDSSHTTKQRVVTR